MVKWDRKLDLRWWKGEERATYIESLQAEIDFGNSWIYEYEWEELKNKISTITEEQAKEEMFIIQEKIDYRLQEWKQYQ